MQTGGFASERLYLSCAAYSLIGPIKRLLFSSPPEARSTISKLVFWPKFQSFTDPAVGISRLKGGCPIENVGILAKEKPVVRDSDEGHI